jgi:DNA-binding transcriptional regulator YiaG
MAMSTSTQSIIKELRADFAMSQTEIAAAIKAPQPRISRWENGDIPPAADDALALLNLLSRLKRERGEKATAP